MADLKRRGSDPRSEVLPLLWRTHQPLPPRARRHWAIDDVVDSAITVADRDGLDRLTMRSVAEQLGAHQMTLYTYVPGKTELQWLMLDTVYARLPGTVRGADWRERMRRVARANYDLHRAHPWAAHVAATRPPSGPGTLGKHERELHALDELALTDVDRHACLGMVLDFARISAEWHPDIPLRRDSGLVGHFAPSWSPGAKAYPLATRVRAAVELAGRGSSGLRARYQFGLEIVLDGIAAVVVRAERTAGSTLAEPD